MNGDNDLRERMVSLTGPGDGDWSDVRRRARRLRNRSSAVAAALVVALGAAGLAVGGRVIGIFDVHGKGIALSSLSAQDRETLVTSMCPHPFLRSQPNHAPEAACREGNPTVEEVANDGSEAHYRIRYPWGLTCLATGRAGGYHSPEFGSSLFGFIGCNAGTAGMKLVPTPQRPVTVDVAAGTSDRGGGLRLLRVSGLAGEGIRQVELAAPGGEKLATAVRGHAYSFTKIPDRNWTAIAALDDSGHEVYREPVLGPHPVPRPKAAPRPVPRPAARPGPVGEPVQRASTPLASVTVYRNGFVDLRFSSTSSDAYRRLARAAGHSRGRVNLTCGKVAYGSGRWKDLAGGVTQTLAPRVATQIGGGGQIGGMPSPPYDFCEIDGTYGRYWNDEEGTHELIEVPFDALARRYLDDRATARDLAYFVRTKKLHRIRLAIHRGEPAPSAAELARIFGERVVPLASRDATAPAGKIGVWTDGKLIVASELTPAGRRLYVTVRDVHIGANNIRDLSFAF